MRVFQTIAKKIELFELDFRIIIVTRKNSYFFRLYFNITIEVLQWLSLELLLSYYTMFYLITGLLMTIDLPRWPTYLLSITLLIKKKLPTLLFINIYIYINLPVNAIVRLLHPRSGDSQGQETFIALSADKQTRSYETECSNHHPSLSTRWPKGLSRSMMKW